MTKPPDGSPPYDVLAYQVSQLQELMGDLGEEMRARFEKLERILDDRLASRDKRIEEVERDLRTAERRLDRKDGRDALLGWILGLFATVTAGGLAALFWEVFKRGMQ